MFSNTAVRTSHFVSRDKLLLLTHVNENPPLSTCAILKIFSTVSVVFLLSGSAKMMHEFYVKLQFRPELCSSVSYSFPQLLGSQSWYPNCKLDTYKMQINVLEQYQYSEFSRTLSLFFFSKLHAVVSWMTAISKYCCLHICTDICPSMALEMGETHIFNFIFLVEQVRLG